MSKIGTNRPVSDTIINVPYNARLSSYSNFIQNMFKQVINKVWDETKNCSLIFKVTNVINTTIGQSGSLEDGIANINYEYTNAANNLHQRCVEWFNYENQYYELPFIIEEAKGTYIVRLPNFKEESMNIAAQTMFTIEQPQIDQITQVVILKLLGIDYKVSKSLQSQVTSMYNTLYMNASLAADSEEVA